jgi:carbamoyl-phosphate synthase small subunit
MSASAKLVLADGTIYAGTNYAATGVVFGQLIFDTTMTGYQHSLTNPANVNSLMVFTFPHIGNAGVNDADAESGRYWPAGVIMREPARVHSNWQAERALEPDLVAAGVVGIAGLDTRALTRHIRRNGVVTAGIFTGTAAESSDAELVTQVRQWEEPTTAQLLQNVTTDTTYTVAAEQPKATIGLIDLGVRRATITQLTQRGNTVTVMPAHTTAKEIAAANLDGVVLSSGPGNPADATDQIALVTDLLQAQTPLLGIGLGHQIIAHALGYATTLMPQAHRGPNQPVYDVSSGQSLITTQNHQYAVEAPLGTHPAPSAEYGDVTVTQYSLNDQSVEALRAEQLPVLTVQYYPENTALAVDEAHPVFDAFAALLATGK